MSDGVTSLHATELPPIIVTRDDCDRLRALADRARGRANAAVVAFLARELDRAEICRPGIVPPDIVTMNARVYYRRQLGLPTEMRTLVYDPEDAPAGAGLPILSPLGVALLGLRAGQRMPYASLDGAAAIVLVERVAYQPEAAGRLLRAPYRYWPRSSGPRSETPPAPPRPEGPSRVIPLRPRPQPQPARPTDGDDPPPDRAA